MSKSTVNEFRDLTNADVEILYNIVTAAQNSQDPPFRAIFAAYDNILAQHGISKDQDRIYFRFLLRMGENRAGTQTLFEQFESLLTKLGFQLDFSDDEISDVDANDSSHENEPEQAARVRSHYKAAHTLSRRASLDSLHFVKSGKDDVLLQYDSTSPNRSHGRAIGLETRLPLRVHNGDVLQPARTLAAQGSSRNTPRSTRANPLNQRTRSADDLCKERLEPKKLVNAPHNTLNPDNQEHHPANGCDISVYPDFMYFGDLASQVFIAADAFELRRTVTHMKAVIRRWCKAAIKRRRLWPQMFKKAAERDRDTLLRQAYDQWRSAFQRRRHARETHEFLDQLEARASKARDLFLLTKAFTHWAKCASDEIVRGCAAKRHLLRTRYFNAWRDITLVNELKIRRARLARFFSIWRRRANHILDQTDDAYLLDESRLIERCYRLWFWQFCERRAPLWSAENLKIRLLRRWLGVTRQVLERKNCATTLRQSKLAHQVISSFQNQIATDSQHERLARVFRRGNLLKYTLSRVITEARFAPLSVRMDEIIDSRLARDTLMIWKDRMILLVQAVQVNKLRIMRNAWTAWNNRLRFEALSRKIGDRIMVEALYRWVLAERALLSERMFIHRLKSRILQRWAARFDELSAKIGLAESLFHNFKNSRSTISFFKNWSCYQQELIDRNQQALKFRNESLSRRTIQRWSFKLQGVRQMQSWTDDARFYTLATRSIKLWAAVTESNKRLKRREAYSVMRRKVKMNLASRLLIKWHDTTIDVNARHLQANRFHKEHLMLFVRNVCTKWLRRTTIVNTANVDASAQYEQQLLQQHWRALVRAVQDVQEIKSHAMEFASGSVEVKASNSLRKLNWQLFQIRRLQETAASLAERNSKKHYRNIIKYWAEKTAQRRNPLSLSPSPSMKFRTVHPGTYLNESGNLGLEWRVSDDKDISRRTSEPDIVVTPGYLRTPSKRTNKSRARFQTPKTPATTRTSPLKERYVVQSSANRVSSARRNFTQRLRSAEPSGFEDILENSPPRGD